MKMPHSKFISYENILINKIITNNYTNPNYYILYFYYVKQLNYYTYQLNKAFLPFN